MRAFLYIYPKLRLTNVFMVSPKEVESPFKTISFLSSSVGRTWRFRCRRRCCTADRWIASEDQEEDGDENCDGGGDGNDGGGGMSASDGDGAHVRWTYLRSDRPTEPTDGRTANRSGNACSPSQPPPLLRGNNHGAAAYKGCGLRGVQR